MDTKPDISKAPPGATHWAPESGRYPETWYRYDGNAWYCIPDYWASDVVECPNGQAAKMWDIYPIAVRRPMSHLISLDTLEAIQQPANIMDIKLDNRYLYQNNVDPDPNAIQSDHKNILAYDQTHMLWDCVSVEHFIRFRVCYPYWMYQPVITG